MGACTVSSLEGRRLPAGRATIARLAALLGLDATPEPFRIRSVAWIDDHVELSVGIGQGREAVFIVERPRQGEPPFFATQQIALRYRGKDVPPALTRMIAAVASKRLAGVTVERIAAVVAADPELGDPRLAMPVTELKHPANQLDTWGADDAWADFFAGGEIARGQLDSIDPTKLFSFVQHCDNECLLVNPTGPVPLVSMVDYPWGVRGRTRLEPPKLPMPSGGDDDAGYGEMITTELNEIDVIRGNPEKVRDALEAATSRPAPGDKIVFFSNTCVPAVTGEDVESVVREYQRKSKVPLLYLTVTPKAMTDVFVDLFVNRRKRAEASAGPPDPRSVNLVGFADEPATAELVQLLAAFGVSVNCLLLPDLDVPRIERLPRAALNVYRPNSVWVHYYEQLGIETRTRQLTIGAPFGVEATRRWIAAVLGALELPFDEAVWAAEVEKQAASWAKAKAQAAGRRLGLVVRAEEIHYLTNPGFTWGIPLVAMLQEAGFGLDVLLHMKSMQNAEPIVDQVVSSFDRGAPHLVVPFRNFEELASVLPRTGCEAVLTHHFFDWRLSQAGKNRFSLQHFEMGLAGAARTTQRLAAVCKTPFYRKYRRWLGRTPEGLRAETTGEAP